MAGKFYPAQPELLRAMVEGWMETAMPVSGRVRALIAPHAGYPYSGELCARAYAACGRRPERVWLLGPSHHVPLRRPAGCAHDAFSTPLGDIAVDREGMDAWTEQGILRTDDAAHRPEHALETHLPMIQVRWPDPPPIVPVLTAVEDIPELDGALLESWRDGDLLAVSSDLSHFHPDPEARERDHRTAEAIEALEPDPLTSRDACGAVAVRLLLRLARQKGWTARRIGLRTSADVTGDRSSVVGYGAWVFVGEEPDG